jgi:hypothetical protein
MLLHDMTLVTLPDSHGNCFEGFTTFFSLVSLEPPACE